MSAVNEALSLQLENSKRATEALTTYKNINDTNPGSFFYNAGKQLISDHTLDYNDNVLYI